MGFQFGVSYMVVGPAGNRSLLGVWAAPAAPKTIPEGGGLRPPPSAVVLGAAGAAQTPKIGDCRPKNRVSQNQAY